MTIYDKNWVIKEFEEEFKEEFDGFMDLIRLSLEELYNETPVGRDACLLIKLNICKQNTGWLSQNEVNSHSFFLLELSFLYRLLNKNERNRICHEERRKKHTLQKVHVRIKKKNDAMRTFPCHE
ncbi:hypothetical protein [Lachnoclostridium phytofermentans]|jgi:hypothetical protein|uniref:hypothetical protein n=1 Tax=Lachnoclostridium phytofermentans TaxID=66219 RepID=UPI0004950C73|nr:hypothetical protein [Lachnoclostridium phytofermentans]